jgi:hypothetical protein
MVARCPKTTPDPFRRSQQHAALGLSGRQLMTKGDDEETTRTPTKAFFDRSWKMGNIEEVN